MYTTAARQNLLMNLNDLELHAHNIHLTMYTIYSVEVYANISVEFYQVSQVLFHINCVADDIALSSLLQHCQKHCSSETSIPADVVMDHLGIKMY